MKQLKVLPLVAIISGLMIGCGGGGGGGGGVSKTQLNFTFVKAQEQSIQTSCKVFSRTYEEVENGDVTDVNSSLLVAYPIKNALDSQLSIIFSNDKGIVDEESRKFVSNGKVSFYVEDVPEGGYVTITERVGFDTYATSYSQEFLLQNKKVLKDIILTAVSPLPTDRCLTGSSPKVEDRNSLKYINSDDILGDDAAVLPYYFISSLETETSNNPQTNSQTDFQALSSDVTMIAQYRNSTPASLFQYGFEDWNSGEIEMRYTGEDKPIRRNSTLSYGSVEIGVSYREQLKTLAKIDSSKNVFYHPKSLSANEVWFATSQAQVINESSGWNATLNVPIDSSWQLTLDESDLFNVSTLSTAKPTLTNNANGTLSIELSNNISINDSYKGVQRVALRPNRDAVDTKLHVIYSLPKETVVVPNIERINAGDLTTYELKQDFWFTSDEDVLNAQYVMDMFHATALSSVDKDAHGLIIDEVTRDEALSDTSKLRSLHLVR